MIKTRILLVVISAAIIWALFLLPKSVVENESQIAGDLAEGLEGMEGTAHSEVSADLARSIAEKRTGFNQASEEEKSAIFADSLADMYVKAGKFDSAAWFAEHAATFFNTTESLFKAGSNYYEAYTFAVDEQKQAALASKTRELLGKVLEENPQNLEAKTKIAMTYLSSGTPMQGITMLREVLAEDPNNELALFNIGMLSMQSGQYELAVERLEKLVTVNDESIQGHLLLGVAYMNTGSRDKARQQFEKVKGMDSDPSVQAAADSYLNDLK